ncbi:hypothetical protein [Natronobeatus ordinarius]|uniref:hypothetical protein n=1 Tax=Natronobeatus ordinarius TaxID=2963433 RepID=UPI0020CE629C|nr:hypothetical protein [Natronobeatus ordinarius]
MSMETFRLEVHESDGSTGIDADVYDRDNLIRTSARVAYDDHGLESVGDGTQSRIVRETTADVTTLDLQYERDDAGFAFRLLGDRDELLSVRVEDETWGLE